jgi:hypothetical protein
VGVRKRAGITGRIATPESTYRRPNLPRDCVSRVTSLPGSTISHRGR